MRTGKLTRQEIVKAEQEQANNLAFRAGGLRIRRDRDQGSVKLRDITRPRTIQLDWNVIYNPDPIKYHIHGQVHEVVIIPPQLPENSVRLTIGKETAIVDAEELRKWLRWC